MHWLNCKLKYDLSERYSQQAQQAPKRRSETEIEIESMITKNACRPRCLHVHPFCHCSLGIHGDGWIRVHVPMHEPPGPIIDAYASSSAAEMVRVLVSYCMVTMLGVLTSRGHARCGTSEATHHAHHAHTSRATSHTTFCELRLAVLLVGENCALLVQSDMHAGMRVWHVCIMLADCLCLCLCFRDHPSLTSHTTTCNTAESHAHRVHAWMSPHRHESSAPHTKHTKHTKHTYTHRHTHHATHAPADP